LQFSHNTTLFVGIQVRICTLLFVVVPPNVKIPGKQPCTYTGF